MGARRRPTLGRYIAIRLGSDWRTQARSFFGRPFGSRSFTEFWRYWNPVYGYYLYYYSYRPLRVLLPRSLAMWLTFVACGFFLHDLVGWTLAWSVRFPEMTAFFAVLGLATVVDSSLRIDLSRYPFAVRALANSCWLTGAWATVRFLAPG